MGKKILAFENITMKDILRVAKRKGRLK